MAWVSPDAPAMAVGPKKDMLTGWDGVTGRAHPGSEAFYTEALVARLSSIVIKTGARL